MMMKSMGTSSLGQWYIVFGSILAYSFAQSVPDVSLSIPQDDTQLKNTYIQFLEGIRRTVPTGKTCYKIKVLPRPEHRADKLQFVLAKIQTHGDLSATFALNATDLYLVAYEVGTTAYFFNEKDGRPLVPMNSVFKGSKRQVKAGRGDYADLERGKAKRGTVTLGIRALFDAVKDLVKETQTPNLDKKKDALLVIIQMLSEAARFKTIEGEVAVDTRGGVKISNTSIGLEQDWAKISEEVQCNRSTKTGWLKKLALMKNIDRDDKCKTAKKDPECP